MKKDIGIIRELARKYMALAREDRNGEKRELHRRVNDLDQIRPVVMLHEIPWAEVNTEGQLDLHCQDPVLRSAENFFRRNIYQYTHFPADIFLQSYYPLAKIVEAQNIGVYVDEKIIAQEDGNHIVAHEYSDQLSTDEALDRIVMPRIIYHEKETREQFNLLGEVMGDIIPIKLKGMDHLSVTTWDWISNLRGVTPLLMDLMDRPEFTHRMVRLLTDVYKSELEQREELGLFDNDPYLLHCTPILNSTLKPNEEVKVTRRNIWGRGAAQIFASVSKEMRREFDIEYMKETVGQCGLVYYGCCEPLHDMIDIVEEIPNLRKIGVTPWADVDVAAEAMGERYVYSSKPNPASVAESVLDEDALRKEMTQILDAIHRNRCHADIVLKDISSCGHNPQNLIRWEQIVMEMVGDYSW